ncbi:MULTISPECIES: nicotinate phosphoribosyltransferase [Cyanophyceae]|uniref:nicotinate phosphoribosyltransferase n=1 Tax=Cyanophyceae TaxID=3028117 RepID=UPI00168A153C|nr:MULTISPECIES: nicotinate phosphoribosyltransferase [Cyanophyceae]MBD1918751.1 nicotinate phosphoribosyltransferase [Phormidium sp. FACHB-77]MBD2033404.1 nicotinate phosphoribosyltransferase [Phormidium sp. FACHB-322]MBD2053903.1 nicotinate phosphoribosyltransferase [Leptolyngbya sp. FACHB-60]
MPYPTLLATPDNYGLLTDLYQLTMVSCYAGEGLADRRASFELFARRLPPGYSYLIAMGLTQAIDYLNNLRFSERHLEALRQTGLFDRAPDEFWQRLSEGGFTGDVWAVPEGTAVFANEPLLRVEAPLWQAQIAETYLLNTLNYQTLVATRAARLRDVAGPDARLLEFGTRRAFSPQGALWAARAALAAGLDDTSNVLAALALGRKPAGTMAHALVMVFTALEGSEDEAFAAFQRYFPGSALLIDTYDTVAAAERLAAQVQRGETQVATVRLDSGDLVALSQTVRSHLPNVKILASGDLDEYEIARLKQAGAVLDGYGLGTKLVTGEPVNGVYKLVDIDGTPVMKEASGKTTLPGRKQIFRRYDGGQAVGDRLGLLEETAAPDEQPLLQLVVKQGQAMQELESLDAIAARTAASVASLPAAVRQLERPADYGVALSDALVELAARTRQHPQSQP